MRIALIRYHEKGNINTRLPQSLNAVQGVYPPLSLAYLGAVLEKKGHEVRVIDAVALNITAKEFREMSEEFSPEIAGITCMTPTIHGALEAARICKETGSVTVLGGPHLAAMPEEVMRHTVVDFGIWGEADTTFAKLADALENGKRLEAIKGLIYRTGKGIKVNEPDVVEDLDRLPFPNRDLLPLDKYDCIITEKPFATMVTTRGCPYQCGFCAKQPSDRKYRMRSAKNIIDEIKQVVAKYGVKEIMFYDDAIASSREHITTLCNEIIKRGINITWEAPCRIDNVDKELLLLMKKAGCIRLRFGIESGNPEVLRQMNKSISIPQAKQVFRHCQELGIETFAYFIIGYLNETPQSIRATIELSRELDCDWAMFTTATPLPDTDLFRKSVAANLASPDYWINFNRGHAQERMPFLVPNADKWTKRAYFAFYFRPRFVAKKLTKLNSLDTVRKYIRGVRGIIAMS